MLLKRRLDLYLSVKNGLAVLLVGMLIMGGGAYIASNPPTFSTTDSTNVVTYTTSLDYQSETVVNNSYLYDKGTVLENKEVYFDRLHPNLEINPQLTQEDANIDAQIEMFAVRNRDSNVIWQRNVPIDDETVSQSDNNQTLTINIPEVQQSMDQRNLELPQGSVVKYRVTFNSQYSYEGQQFEQEASLTIQPDTPQTYRVTTIQESETKSQQQTNVRPVPSKTTEIYDYQLETNGIIATFAGLIVFVLGIYLLYGVRFDSRTDDERLFAYHLEKYTDWITFGRPFTDPQFMSQNERNKIKVNSLKGLVQVSVDSDTRVIYSEELNRFYIFADEHIYIFDPPNATSPLDIDSSIPPVPKPDFGMGSGFESDSDDNEFPGGESDRDDNSGTSWMDEEVPDNSDSDSETENEDSQSEYNSQSDMENQESSSESSSEKNEDSDDKESNAEETGDVDESNDEEDSKSDESNDSSGGWEWK